MVRTDRQTLALLELLSEPKMIIFSIIFVIILTLITLSTIVLYFKIYFYVSSDTNIISKAILEHPRRGKMKKVFSSIDNKRILYTASLKPDHESPP